VHCGCRLPLATAHRGDAGRDALAPFADLVADEVNVKDVVLHRRRGRVLPSRC
jgi:hypothetical protein